jgi:hypothetical protein
MGYVVGIVVAVVVFGFARFTRLDRDGAFYPTVLVVVAHYYVLFATIGGSSDALLVELIGMAAFVLVAVLGFKWSSWLVAAGLAAHGVFDVVHPHVVQNPGVPDWWPAFCATFDVGIAALLAVFALARSRPASGSAETTP